MQIWEKLKSAPEDGAEALVAAYSERLYKFAYRLCGDASRSEDLAIRTLAKAVRANGDFASEQAYFTFLCAILVNLHRDDIFLTVFLLCKKLHHLPTLPIVVNG